MEALDGSWWLMTSDGSVVEKIDVGSAAAHTIIQGVKLASPKVGDPARAAEPEPEMGTNAAGETVELPVITTGASQLKAARTVMASLELCDVLGEVASIDVSQTGNLSLWYGTRFKVLLGSTKHMDKKIAWMADTIDGLEDYQTGTVDVTFTARPDQAVFTSSEVG